MKRTPFFALTLIAFVGALVGAGCDATLEGGPPDLGTSDIGLPQDAPLSPDGGPATDGGTAPDAGVDNGAPQPDATPQADAAPEPDASPQPDASQQADAAPEPDASPQPDATPQADATPQPDAPAGTVLWSATHETGDKSEWYYPSTGPTGNYGGGEYNSGIASSTVSTTMAHGGSYALACTISTPSTPQSGVRFFRWRESRDNREAYYSAWFYFPQSFTLTADPSTGQFWNLVQFKSRSTGGRNDPLWAFYADNTSGGGLEMRAGWGWGGSTVAGPHSTDGVGGKNYSQSIATIPIGQWVHFEAFLRQSKDFDGQVVFWQDGVKIFDFSGVRTSYDNPTYNSWSASNEWAVNNYSDGLDPSPATIYIDDAVIATYRVGP
jgi:hypothetical protein